MLLIFYFLNTYNFLTTMSFKAILKIDGKDYNLLDVQYNFRRYTDFSGYVTNIIRFEQIKFVITSPGNTFFLQWMFSATVQKSGTISFYDDEDKVKKVKQLIFAGAFCINYKEVFHSISREPFKSFITLSAGGVKIEESIFRFPWFKGPLAAPREFPLETVVVKYLQNEESIIDEPLKDASGTKKVKINGTPETNSAVSVSISFSKGLQDKIGEQSTASRNLLLKDLSENVHLLKSFEDNHDLVDGWKVLDDAGSPLRTNIVELGKVTNNIDDFKNLGYNQWKKIDNLIFLDALTHLKTRKTGPRKKV